MGFYDDMAVMVRELLGEGPDSFGEDIEIKRGSGAYDSATRKRSAGSTAQTVRGTLDSELASAFNADTLVGRYERVLYAAPLETGGFEPKGGDRAESAGEGKVVQVAETGHVIKQGIAILWVCGLEAA